MNPALFVETTYQSQLRVESCQCLVSCYVLAEVCIKGVTFEKPKNSVF
jgi:hypothetical protein